MPRAAPAPELREAIAPFRALYRDIVRAVEALPDGELHRLASMPPFFGQTNCAWDEYAAVQIVAPLARGELSRRTQKAERALTRPTLSAPSSSSSPASGVSDG